MSFVSIGELLRAKGAIMPKFAIYQDSEWIKDVEADTKEDAVSLDPKATRAELISEIDSSDKGR